MYKPGITADEGGVRLIHTGTFTGSYVHPPREVDRTIGDDWVNFLPDILHAQSNGGGDSMHRLRKAGVSQNLLPGHRLGKGLRIPAQSNSPQHDAPELRDICRSCEPRCGNHSALHPAT